MNNKRIIKIFSVALMVAMVAMCISNVAFAADVPVPTGNPGSGTAKTMQGILNTILGITQVIGVAVAVIMLIVLAIKYISAAPGDKAEIKKHAVIYVVGAVILFGASGIIEIIKKFALDTMKAA